MSHAATGPDAGRLRTYALWASLAGVAFFAIYPTLNWLTSLRSHRFHLYLPTELSIPFVPQFIWAYLSMYALLLLPLFVLPTERMAALGKQLVAGTVASGAVFLLLPAELGFVRVIPSDPIYASIYASIFGVDRPHNLVPSLHDDGHATGTIGVGHRIRAARSVGLDAQPRQVGPIVHWQRLGLFVAELDVPAG